MSLLKTQKAIFLFLIVGHLCVLFTRRDFFPFSPYPMYSESFVPQTLKLRKVIGTNETGEESEILIKNYYPFWQTLLFESLLAKPSRSSICEKLSGIARIHRESTKVQFKKVSLRETHISWAELAAHQKLPPLTNTRVAYECAL